VLVEHDGVPVVADPPVRPREHPDEHLRIAAGDALLIEEADAPEHLASEGEIRRHRAWKRRIGEKILLRHLPAVGEVPIDRRLPRVRHDLPRETPDGSVVGPAHEVPEPPLRRDAIGIREREDLPIRAAYTRIACRVGIPRAAVRQHRHGKAPGNLTCRVPGTVVHHDNLDLPLGIVEVEKGRDAVPYLPCGVARGNDHRNRRVSSISASNCAGGCCAQTTARYLLCAHRRLRKSPTQRGHSAPLRRTCLS